MGFVKLDELPELKLTEGIRARAINGENLSVVHVMFDAGAVAPEHKHLHEQVVNVIEGELELVVEGKAHRLTRGKAMLLAPHVPHSARAVTACYIIDVFHPVREDMRGAQFGGFPPAGKK